MHGHLQFVLTPPPNICMYVIDMYIHIDTHVYIDMDVRTSIHVYINIHYIHVHTCCDSLAEGMQLWCAITLQLSTWR